MAPGFAKFFFYFLFDRATHDNLDKHLQHLFDNDDCKDSEDACGKWEPNYESRLSALALKAFYFFTLEKDVCRVVEGKSFDGIKTFFSGFGKTLTGEDSTIVLEAVLSGLKKLHGLEECRLDCEGCKEE